MLLLSSHASPCLHLSCTTGQVAPVSLPYSLASLSTSALACVAHLRITNSSQPLDLSALALQCPNLHTLDIHRCRFTTDLAPLVHLARSLQHLTLVATKIHSTAPLASLPGLRTINLTSSATPRRSAHACALDLAPLACCPDLRALSAGRCELRGVHTLSSLTRLTHLDLHRCGASVTDLSFASRLTNLTRLNVASCHGLVSLAPLGPALRNLTTLDLSFCWSLTDLAPITACTALRSLSISGCPGIPSLRPLAPCTQLAHLDASLCTGLTDASTLPCSLEHLDLSGTAVHKGEGEVRRLVAACKRLRVLKVQCEAGGDEEAQDASDSDDSDGEGSDASDSDVLHWDELDPWY